LWGSEEWIVNNEKYCGKILYINAGHRCSYHYHKIKDEVFFVLLGKVKMEVDNDTFYMMPGDAVHIPTGTLHRFTGITIARIIEVSTQHFEDDSYRLINGGKVDE
jgi:mannose-6-phosphate isomerase-like protein (cupin superfamily)